MMDVHSKEVRSYNMSRIKGKNTKPEMMVRKFLFSNGFRYRLHGKDLPGKPDVVLKKYKALIFINGCFWHGHDGCKYYTIPKTRTDWWLAKINMNVEKDKSNTEKLKLEGWRIFTLWECQLKTRHRETTLATLMKELIND